MSNKVKVSASHLETLIGLQNREVAANASLQAQADASLRSHAAILAELKAEVDTAWAAIYAESGFAPGGRVGLTKDEVTGDVYAELVPDEALAQPVQDYPVGVADEGDGAVPGVVDAEFEEMPAAPVQ